MRARDPEIAELLLQRQAAGLRVPAVARILFSSYGLAAALTGDVPRDFLWVVFTLVALTFAANGYFLQLLRRYRHVELVGWIGALIDVVFVATYPLLLKAVLSAHGLHWAYGFKAPYALVCISMIVINALALRPLYPTLVGGAAIATHLVLVLLARADPAVIWSAGVRENLTGPAINAAHVGATIIFVALITVAIYFVTRGARRTVEEAVARQAERARLAREHADSVQEGRLDAVRNLVAALSHEMNTPLGAVKSAAATISSAAQRLAAQRETDGAQADKLLRLIAEAAPIPEEACARLEALLQRLTAFSHLDAGEASLVDVNEALDRTVALIPASVVGEAEVARDYQAHTAVRVPPARLNLALMTIVTNAFEANGGHGRVRLYTRDGHRSDVLLEIADEGPGLSAAAMERIFDVHIDDGSRRVKAGLGLPAAYSLIRRHGGDITIRSAVGGGACFSISLPGAGNAPPAE